MLFLYYFGHRRIKINLILISLLTDKYVARRLKISRKSSLWIFLKVIYIVTLILYCRI